jgi:tyrosine-protein kinase Etk/Wzc
VHPDNNRDIQLVDSGSRETTYYNRDIQLADSGSRETTLNDFLGIFVSARWLIAGFVLVFFLAGLIHAMVIPSVYRSDAMLHVDDVVGIGALDDFAGVSDFVEAFTLDMEIEFLTSRSVIGEVVDKYNLDVAAEPAGFPILGADISWFNTLEEISGGWLDLNEWLDLNSYAWGHTSIDVKRFKVPRTYLGEVFTLVAGEDGLFQILGPEGEFLAEGRVGVPVRAWLPTDESLTLLVSKLNASPGTNFELSRSLRAKTIDNLRNSLEVTPLGGLTEDPTAATDQAAGLVAVALTGSERAKITNIVNETVEVYLRQNARRKSAEIESTLNFLRHKVPQVKARLQEAEAALNEYRLQERSVDVSMQTEGILDKIVAVEDELSLLRRDRQRLLQRFTPRHDTMIALDTEIATLEGQLRTLEQQVERLPKTQREILRLQRNVKANGQLYTTLLNRMHELEVLRAGTSSNVRVIDKATMPYKPVGLTKPLVIAFYPFIGLILGMGWAFVRKSVDEEAVEDPDVIEKQLGLPVYAVVPHSTMQYKLQRKGERYPLLAAAHAEDLAIESVRSLRTWLNYAFMETKNKLILITGPGPDVGKSFLSSNLAFVLANAGKRVLLIDADMRKGHLHRYFHLRRESGLSEAISGTVGIRQAIYKVGPAVKLFLMPTGKIPPNPSELLAQEGFASIMQELSGEFDYIVVDSPPVLGITDAAMIGRLTAGALLVTLADAHPLRELEQSVKTLRRSGTNVLGVVFNDMDISSGRYGYGRYYGYEYRGYYAEK